MQEALKWIENMKDNEELFCVIHDLKTDIFIHATFDMDKEQMEQHIKNIKDTDFKVCWLKEKEIV